MPIPYVYTDFSGGLNTKDGAYVTTDNQSRDLQNVQGTTGGAIIKRNGLSTFASPVDTLHSLFACEATASSFLIGAGGTTIYKITTGGTSSSIKTGVTAGKLWEWATITADSGQGPLFGVNGTDTPQQWDGTAGTTSDWTAGTGAVPNGKYIVQFGNRIWVAGTSAKPSRLYFSDLAINGGAHAWPAANVVDLAPDDGQQITGLHKCGPYLLVGKNRKLFVIYDQDTGANRQITDSTGVASHRSLAEGPEGCYFLAEDRGVYRTDGSKIQAVSDIIQPTFDSIVSGKRPVSAGVYFNGHYYLSVCRSGSANDTVLDFDTVLQSWWLHTFGSAQWAVWHPATAAGLFSAKTTAAVVDQAFAPGVLVDNGTPFQWVWRGPWQSPSYAMRRRFPTPYYRKRFRQFRMRGAGTVDVSFGSDFSGGEVLWGQNVFAPADAGTFGGSGTFGGTGLFGGSPQNDEAVLFTLGVMDAVSPVFSATSTTADTVTLYMYAIKDRVDMIPATV